MNIKIIIALILIVFLGGFLRIYALDKAPQSLNWDEVSWGYNAYSIKETLRDEYGQFLPIFPKAFGEYKPALPSYLMIPSLAVFGLNETGVRFPSAFLGTVTIIIVFFLCKKIFNNSVIALSASLIFAASPLLINLSRIYHDANAALFCLVLGLLFYFYRGRNFIYLILSFIFFIISMYTYNANKLLVPLFLTGLAILNYKEFLKLDKYKKIILGLILGTGFLGFIYYTLTGVLFVRAGAVNIFDAWSYLTTDLVSHGNGLLDLILHNKPYYFLWDIVGRYFGYFSPYNLFLKETKDTVTPVVGSSVFHSFEFIFWVIGLYLFLTKYKNKELLLLMFLAPVPAILTQDWFHAGRVMTLLFVHSIVIGVGLAATLRYIYDKFPKFITLKLKLYVLVLSVAGIYFISSIYFFDSLFVATPYRDRGMWQQGFRESAQIINKSSSGFDKIIVDTPHGQPYIFYLFYGGYSPATYLNEAYREIGPKNNNHSFSKFEFRKIYWPEDRKLHKILFVGDEFSLPDDAVRDTKNAKIIDEVKDFGGDILIRIVGLE